MFNLNLYVYYNNYDLYAIGEEVLIQVLKNSSNFTKIAISKQNI